ncbi:MAG TPA: ribonuclease P protein component [Candidatus Saccharimonadales bacterium]|nr:ribonuclease P protein component [Candidatus Saccharimonadales bacterium]
MLSRAHRFHGLGSLNFVYRQGQTVRSAGLSLKFIRNPKRQTYRAAAVISRKVQKSAVRRNRIRRRIYEIVRTRQADISQPYDLVFSVFNEQLAEIETLKLQRIVQELLEKAGVIASPKPPERDIVKSERERS